VAVPSQNQDFSWYRHTNVVAKIQILVWYRHANVVAKIQVLAWYRDTNVVCVCAKPEPGF
jgi:hypothetical protein